ncbi:hypothetical protein I2486_12135 [Cellulophaga sp. E16_2]|uniref:DUF6249 domain-containing protein n=1 Tax=Cellulophaga algicola (strain DSM 14237 / IC166 / ACAM 630) TaxID=688270 RepID=E6X871_CELAD|nr:MULTISPECIES: DUF6249 domain-containing protein [Cellulophaga]ADV49697.1 hypothetical protein Celal_2407 [Cellulophaga algicola DSM 14237]MBO0592152.1 hypothetical protein [Cellulophaga sp. E16_2]
MAVAILIPVSFFLLVFGITYLYYSTRNRERMALIEKDLDATIFNKAKRENTSPVWKIFILNFSLLLIGVGLAIFIASILVANIGVPSEVAYPATIFLMAGIALLAGFFVSKKLTS